MSDADLTLLCANKVMGWNFTDTHAYATVGDYLIHSGEFNPLNDDCDAMAIIDKLLQEGWPSQIGNNCVVKGEEHYCHVWHNATFESYTLHATTRRRAIVLAALRAKGVEVE